MYCVKCGGETSFEIISGDTIPRNICKACNHIHYVNPKIIVGALPCRDDQVLWKWENL